MRGTLAALAMVAGLVLWAGPVRAQEGSAAAPATGVAGRDGQGEEQRRPVGFRFRFSTGPTYMHGWLGGARSHALGHELSLVLGKRYESGFQLGLHGFYSGSMRERRPQGSSGAFIQHFAFFGAGPHFEYLNARTGVFGGASPALVGGSGEVGGGELQDAIGFALTVELGKRWKMRETRSIGLTFRLRYALAGRVDGCFPLLSCLGADSPSGPSTLEAVAAGVAFTARYDP